MTKCIMFQGTGSHVGKSVLVAALSRIFLQDGYKVAPFKSQNMALNSYVTKDGGEMGRAQVVQAEAAGLEPDVLMNPVLLKPTGQASSQVIVLGRPVGNMSAQEYHEKYNLTALGVIEESLQKLKDRFEIIVIEGAGSPAEVNLQAREIVNMRIARMADAPVLLVADIDKGGALASVVGTLELLDPADRTRVAGVVINKFRGDVRLFQPAIDFLEEKTGIPVLGVVPYFQGFRVQEEDTIPEATLLAGRERVDHKLDVVVINLPHISNFTDFDPLEDEPDVQLRYINKGSKLGRPDLVIIPGSKNTIHDLVFLEKSGLAPRITALAREGVPVIGICGGYQILGRELHDPLHTESDIDCMRGLGLIDMVTTFEPDKITTQVQAEIVGSGYFLTGVQGLSVTGYEIHMGRSQLAPGVEHGFRITERSTRPADVLDGAVSGDGRVFGTYIHGIFDSDTFRRHILNLIRQEKGWGPLEEEKVITVREQREKDFDKLAEVVRSSLDIDKIYEIMGLEPAAEERRQSGAVRA
ncbi:MAG: cobyric acid synthase [Bacillota bacterium]